jgi:hypothetical protein
MDERVRRTIEAVEYQANVVDGRMIFAIPPRPLVGSQLSFTANINIDMIPSQKPGMDCPINANNFPQVSQNEFR